MTPTATRKPRPRRRPNTDTVKDDPPATPESGKSKGGLFDPAEYDDPRLHLESREGRTVGEIRLPFSGTIVLNRKDPGDVQFFKSLHQGQRVELASVEVTVVTDAEKSSYGKDGEEKTLAAVKSLRVTGITVPATG